MEPVSEISWDEEQDDKMVETGFLRSECSQECIVWVVRGKVEIGLLSDLVLCDIGRGGEGH